MLHCNIIHKRLILLEYMNFQKGRFVWLERLGKSDNLNQFIICWLEGKRKGNFW